MWPLLHVAVLLLTLMLCLPLAAFTTVIIMKMLAEPPHSPKEP